MSRIFENKTSTQICECYVCTVCAVFPTPVKLCYKNIYIYLQIELSHFLILIYLFYYDLFITNGSIFFFLEASAGYCSVTLSTAGGAVNKPWMHVWLFGQKNLEELFLFYYKCFKIILNFSILINLISVGIFFYPKILHLFFILADFTSSQHILKISSWKNQCS